MATSERYREEERPENAETLETAGAPEIVGEPLWTADPSDLGPYRVLRRLGQGGMGTVFLARDPSGREVAVKVIRADLAHDRRFRERFRREADAARRVAGFCTATVLDADPDADAPYLVTEFVEGPSLARAVAENGPLSPANLEGLAVGVAAALSAIHAAGVVHRDLKPSNVILSRYGPRVIDFGIARAESGEVTSSQELQRLGTPAFMAPEQVRGDDLTPAVDVFAWGGLVAYAGTGRFAFGDGPPEALAYRAVHAEPQLDGLDPRLRGAVETAMSKDPAARPTAADLLRQLVGGVGPAGGTATALTQIIRDWEPEQLPAAPVAPAPTPVPPAAPVPAPMPPPAPMPAPPPAPRPRRRQRAPDEPGGRRLLDYAGSAKNIAGCVGGAGGLGLVFTHVIGAPEWPFVVAALYAIGALVAPPARAPSLPPPPTPKELREELDAHERSYRRRLPLDARTAHRNVIVALRDLLDRPTLLPPGTPEAFVIERTIRDYLPTALDAYLGLPRAFAEDQAVDGTKTAKDVLISQLDLMAKAVADVTTSAARGDSARLLAHGRFLADRFGRGDSGLTIGDG